MFTLAEIGVVHAEDVVADSLGHNAKFLCRYDPFVAGKIW
jgi:hypothetical protein